MRRRTIGLLVAAAIAVLVGSTVWTAGRSLGAEEGLVPDGDEPDAGDRTTLAKPYGKYQQLAICVHVVEGSATDGREARRQFRAAVSAFNGVRPWPGGVQRVYQFPPLIDIGCPTEPARFRPDGRGLRVADRPTDPLPAPSPYWLHVFIVSPETLATYRLDPRLVHRTLETEEYATDNLSSDVSVGKTTGLYATVVELADVAAIELFLEWPYGLRRKVPLTPPTGSSAVPKTVDRREATPETRP